MTSRGGNGAGRGKPVRRARGAAEEPSGAAAGPGGARTDLEVTEMLRASDHPMTREIDAVRHIILGAAPEIREGVKWNAPSFRTSDWFATLNNPNAPRARDRVMLVLHAGAKAKGIALRGRIADPAGLLEWLADDRCTATFANAGDIEAKREALASIVREWIRLV